MQGSLFIKNYYVGFKRRKLGFLHQSKLKAISARNDAQMGASRVHCQAQMAPEAASEV
jgi:hypothetical protein